MSSNLVENLLRTNKRKLVVCSREINLSMREDNQIYILFVEESKGSAGGRAGGSGFRKISRIIGIKCHGNDQRLYSIQKEKMKFLNSKYHIALLQWISSYLMINP